VGVADSIIWLSAVLEISGISLNSSFTSIYAVLMKNFGER
jgi:hypothetical protein